MTNSPDNSPEKKTRPLLANVAIKVDVPAHLTDEEVLADIKKKMMFGKWTDASYTPGPNGTVVDQIAGYDV